MRTFSDALTKINDDALQSDLSNLAHAYRMAQEAEADALKKLADIRELQAEIAQVGASREAGPVPYDTVRGLYNRAQKIKA
jgi:septation ring formation regulator EzrA